MTSDLNYRQNFDSELITNNCQIKNEEINSITKNAGDPKFKKSSNFLAL